MYQLEVSKKDLVNLENLMKILKRGKFELAGEEILSMAQVISWVSTRYTDIETVLKNTKEPAALKEPPGDGEETTKIIRRRRKG